ncbi:MAG TPA: hypothetical protein PKH07_18995, partial [bacterium]|nr:hypothetical protein [bacterium]
DKVDHVKTVPLDEAIRKGTVAVSIIFTDNGQKANVTLTRQEGHGGFHVRITQGLHNLPSGGRTVQVRADSELTLNLATSSIATASLAVAR